MEQVILTLEWVEGDKIVLTNKNCDTYTSESEHLIDFLHSAGVETPIQTPKAAMSKLELKCQDVHAHKNDVLEVSEINSSNMMIISALEFDDSASIVINRDQAIQLIQHLKTQFGI